MDKIIRSELSGCAGGTPTRSWEGGRQAGSQAGRQRNERRGREGGQVGSSECK